MAWPWVSRTVYETTLADRAARIEELRAQLNRAESERREAQLQMLRLTMGLPIFPEQGKPPAPEQTAAEALPQLNFEHMAEEEINANLVAEAKRAGCVTMGQVIQHVSRRKAELWREAHPVVNTSEMKARAEAVDSMMSAVAEGVALANEGGVQ